MLIIDEFTHVPLRAEVYPEPSVDPSRPTLGGSPHLLSPAERFPRRQTRSFEHCE